jgi:hypothetical protein
MIHRVIIEVEPARVIRLQIPPDPHRSTLCDHVFCGGTWADVEWYPDGTQLAFVSSSRDHKQAKLRVSDARTGAVREVLEETVPTQFESGKDPCFSFCGSMRGGGYCTSLRQGAKRAAIRIPGTSIALASTART